MQEQVSNQLRDLGVSATDIHRRSGVSASTVTRFLKGQSSLTLDTVEKIFHAYGRELTFQTTGIDPWRFIEAFAARVADDRDAYESERLAPAERELTASASFEKAIDLAARMSSLRDRGASRVIVPESDYQSALGLLDISAQRWLVSSHGGRGRGRPPIIYTSPIQRELQLWSRVEVGIEMIVVPLTEYAWENRLRSEVLEYAQYVPDGFAIVDQRCLEREVYRV